MTAVYQSVPYSELLSLQDPDCAVLTEYHGQIPQQVLDSAPKVLIYSCLGEALSDQQLAALIEDFPQTFVIILTVQHYHDMPHVTDRYCIFTVPTGYAWYSEWLPEMETNGQEHTFCRKFLSLNNRAQWPRQALAQFLLQAQLLDDFYFSYHCQDRFGQGTRQVFDEINRIIGRTWYNHDVSDEELWAQLPFALPGDRFEHNDWSFGEPEYYTGSFASVVNETYINENWDPFFTEKTFKPLAYRQPFLLFSSAGALAALRDLGFETFSEVFDESYDEIESPQQRFEHVLREIRRVCHMPLQDLQAIYRDIEPKLEHNHWVFRHDLSRRYRQDISIIQSNIRGLLEEKYH